MILTEPLHDKCAPDNVKYLVRHLLKSRHFPFFSFNCPSITGCASPVTSRSIKQHLPNLYLHKYKLPLRKPTARSGCAQRKHPHFSAKPPSTGSSGFLGHNWKTSKYPDERSSFMRISWSFAQGKALVTTVRNVLFSHFRMSQQCFRLATWASRELSAWECRA